MSKQTHWEGVLTVTWERVTGSERFKSQLDKVQEKLLHNCSQTLKSDEAKWSKLTKMAQVCSFLGGKYSWSWENSASVVATAMYCEHPKMLRDGTISYEVVLLFFFKKKQKNCEHERLLFCISYYVQVRGWSDHRYSTPCRLYTHRVISSPSAW